MTNSTTKELKNGSIPGKWATRLLKTSGSSRKGFGSSDSRFDNSHINDRPGPGFYAGDTERSLIKNGPSYSKKGYGNAFLSKRERIVYTDNRVPGPGEYNMPLSPSGYGIVFVKSGKGRVPFPEPIQGPGPLDYRVHFPGAPLLLKAKQSATFESASKRDSFFGKVSDAPGVCTYDLGDLSVKKTSFMWSTSTFKRFTDMGQDNKVPPPTTYFTGVEQIVNDRRTSGSYHGSYLGKQNDVPVATLHTFGADTERFKHSFCGRLDIAATLPGPGAYVIKRDGDIRQEDKVKPTQAFCSKSPHRLAVHKPGTPGPLYYKPAQPVTTAQCTNQDGRWV